MNIVFRLREGKVGRRVLTTLISCTKARPNLTCTFSVMFCTGRMSLLYPRNRSRTSLSSSSEHRPVSKTSKRTINKEDPSARLMLRFIVIFYCAQIWKTREHASLVSSLMFHFSRSPWTLKTVLSLLHRHYFPQVFLGSKLINDLGNGRCSYRCTESPRSGIVARDADKNTFWAGSSSHCVTQNAE